MGQKPEQLREWAAIFTPQLYGNAKSAKLDRFLVELLSKVAIIQGIGGRSASKTMMKTLDKAGFQAHRRQAKIFLRQRKQTSVQTQTNLPVKAA